MIRRPSIVQRWPPTHLHPKPASGNQFGAVQVKRDYGSATARCQADDFGSVSTPCKMIVPLLPPGIPQPAALSRRGIDCLDARSLEFVAGMTREPEVRFDGLAPAG